MNKRCGLAVMVSVTLFLSLLSSSVSAASSKPFKDCSELTDKYLWGVALNFTAAADGFNLIAIRPKVYRANSKLDKDKDGVACEDESIQHRPLVVTTSTTTTIFVQPTIATTSTVSIPTRIPPSGDWDGDMLYSSEILLYGNRYQHVLCTSGSPKTTLKLWQNVNGSYVQKAESFPVVGDTWCPDPAYPVKHRFFWTVDWLGTQSSGNRYSLALKVTGMTSDSYVNRTVFTSAGLTQDANEIARKIACIFGKVIGC